MLLGRIVTDDQVGGGRLPAGAWSGHYATRVDRPSRVAVRGGVLRPSRLRLPFVGLVAPWSLLNLRPNLRHRQPWYEFLDRRVHVDDKRGGARPRGRRSIVLIFCRVREQPFALILKLRFTQVHTTANVK